MKTPRFWYASPGWQSALLAPLGQAYRAVGKVRRLISTPYRAPVPVICIGNLVAGGAGKTPAALAIAHLLQRHGAKPAFVSRGYGGSLSGPLRVDPDRHTAAETGDEPLILARTAPTWIAADRPAALRAAAASGATHLIMDDGLQNPTVTPTISFLVIDTASGLGNNHLIPAGPLRETLADAMPRIAAIIEIERSASRPAWEEGQEGGLSPQRRVRQLKKPTLRARLTPRLPEDFNREKTCLAFAGIGRPEKFYASCREAGLTLAATRDFPDHHSYSAAELQTLATTAAHNQWRLITTAKDWVRLPDPFRAGITVLPVELVFDDAEALRALLPV